MKRMWDKKVLQGSTAQIVKSMVESGALDNAKPIYCHPINLYSNTLPANMSALILSNDPEPLDTWAKVKAAIAQFVETGNARLVTTGAAVLTGTLVVASCIIYRTSDQTYSLQGIDVTSLGLRDVGITSESFTVYDGVNKVN